MRSRRALVAPVVLCLVLPAAAQADDARARRPFAPGAPGAGDPYFPLDGNGGYDVGHYLLDVDYEPSTDVLSGDATVTARATQDLSSFTLDLDGLTVRAVTVDGRPATWSRDGGELRITPGRGLPEGSRFTAVVRYDGVPRTMEEPPLRRSGFVHTDDGALVAGQPHVASTWFPVNDHPRDKAAYTFRVTVPEGLEAVANGALEDRRTRHGRTTWTWRAREPMASYLSTATIGEFDLRAYSERGIPYWDAVDPDLLRPAAGAAPQLGENVERSLARQDEILDFLADLFGPYPFRAAGGIVDDAEGVGFALENQTRPIYSKGFFADPATGDRVVVHELAHQWCGDSLTVAAWRHIWLNEGFATYAQWLWDEREQRGSAQATFDRLYTGLPADSPFWTVTVGDPGPAALFDRAVYDRGAMTLHRLRLAVGDEDFFRILREWTTSKEGRHVTTPEFVRLAQRVSGEDLTALFDTWLSTPGKPDLTAPGS